MRRALSEFWTKSYRDGITGLAGMVAYNLLLSLLPLTLVALFVLSRLIGSDEIRASVVADLQRILPTTESSNITGLLNGLESRTTSLGIAALVASIWIGASFWGALDTAFCRIYHSPCRSWVEQKRFALGMLVVVLLFIASTVAVPALQSIVTEGAEDLPFGLDAGRTVYVAGLLAGLAVLFGTLCVVYVTVPNEPIPWRGIWPGAAGATAAIGVVDYGFPFYLSQVSVVSTFGGTYVFVLILLIWFYVVALILLGGAVINALRLGHREEL